MYNQLELCNPGKQQHRKNTRLLRDVLGQDRLRVLEAQNLDSFGLENQPVYIDLIIKIMICRVYTNIKDKRVLTAEKIIGMAEKLIRLIENGQLQIITYPEMRAGSNPYSHMMLKKKFLLHNGILQFALNKDDEA